MGKNIPGPLNIVEPAALWITGGQSFSAGSDKSVCVISDRRPTIAKAVTGDWEGKLGGGPLSPEGTVTGSGCELREHNLPQPMKHTLPRGVGGMFCPSQKSGSQFSYLCVTVSPQVPAKGV